MRRLHLWLVGRSTALQRLADELRDHGHRLQLIVTQAALDEAGPLRADLVLDDGSLQGPGRPQATEYLRLNVTASAPAFGQLPHVQLLGWYGPRLVLCDPVPTCDSSNGKVLSERAVEQLIDTVAQLVSRYSRDSDVLRQMPALDSHDLPHPQGLRALEALTFEHVLNRTQRADLLEVADIPLSTRLRHSLTQFADRPALQVGGTLLSYRELQGRAAAIEQSLQPWLATTSAPVIALCIERCVELYAAIVAILGSGAVYVPLDPAHPRERRQYIVENAGADLLLHGGHNDLTGVQALDVRAIPPRAQPLHSKEMQGLQPCMTLYTSGTTGRPKGVSLSQRNLSHFSAWYADQVQLAPHSRVLQFSTLSFDSSLIDILPTWLSGARLVVPSEDQRRDPRQLVSFIQQQQLSHAFLPPALLSILPAEQPLGLLHLSTGGDVCEPWVIERMAAQCAFHNLYGPTEGTVLITARRMQAGDPNRLLGGPIANSQVFILDEQGEPVRDGEVGEIHIAGPGVALGYVANSEQTAERYLWIELADGPRLRAYRTGDLGRWTPAGIELSGRRDNQVKIRGFRVEPEEIERCLRESQQYGQVAVVIDPQRRILAFVAQPRSAGAGETLKQHARAQLPDYMQPTLYSELPGLPSASNGKVDRAALLAMPVNFADRPDHTLAQTPDEARLLGLWSELLELPEHAISTTESFFNLGGHSILLSQLLVLIGEHFGRGISINRFIEQPTVRNLGRLLGDTASGAGSVSPQALIDCERPLALTVLGLECMGDVHRVIVTGANSFVGVHIVQALLDWGATEVACLIRGDARARFIKALDDNRLGALDLSRVTLYSADLRQERLGLSVADYERLDREFGAMVHNAANVNHVLDYESLVADNVEPIFQCLRLCEGQRKKVFNFVSTLSASSAVDGQGQVLEAPAAATPPVYIRNGYNVSKWVAERILERARQQGVRVNVYRPGNISFNSQTGVCQPHKNRLMLMLKGSLQLGQVPALTLNFDLMPVDFLARFIAFHCSQYASGASVFNLHNPQPLSWGDYVASFRGPHTPFELVSVAQWQQQLKRVDSSNALFGVLGFYLDGFEEDIGDISSIHHAHALAGVNRMGEHYPEKTPALLRRGRQYLSDIQFI